jgi:hypothetical protein
MKTMHLHCCMRSVMTTGGGTHSYFRL